MSDNKKRSYFKDKNNYFSQKKKKALSLEAGLRGFFCTCNFQEKNCVREAYNLLNEYADKLIDSDAPASKDTDEIKNESDDCAAVDEDISDVLEKQISELKSGTPKTNKFQSVATSAPNCLFIRTTIEDPVKLGHSIVQDIAATKTQKTRFLLRMVPIEATCGVKLYDIVDTAGKLFDRYFLGEPTTFSIVFNRRFNNSLSRDVVIKELADLVVAKNVEHKANLTNPKLSVIVEIIKGICLLSVVPDYYQFKKYNLIELCATPVEKAAEAPADQDPAIILNGKEDATL